MKRYNTDELRKAWLERIDNEARNNSQYFKNDKFYSYDTCICKRIYTIDSYLYVLYNPNISITTSIHVSRLTKTIRKYGKQAFQYYGTYNDFLKIEVDDICKYAIEECDTLFDKYKRARSNKLHYIYEIKNKLEFICTLANNEIIKDIWESNNNCNLQDIIQKLEDNISPKT